MFHKPRIEDLVNVNYRQHTRYQGCVGHWLFGVGGGTTVWEISGRGNKGTMSGMDPATDWIQDAIGGSGLDFDGTNDIVSSISSTIYSLPQYTYMFWMSSPNVPSAGGFAQPFACEKLGRGAFSWDHSDVGFRQGWGDKDSIGFKSAVYTTSLLANTLYLLIGTYDGTNLKAILKGVTEATTAMGTPTGGAGGVSFGAANSGGDNSFFAGRVYEARIYDRPVTNAEALSHDQDRWLEFRLQPFALKAFVAAGGIVLFRRRMMEGHR